MSDDFDCATLWLPLCDDNSSIISTDFVATSFASPPTSPFYINPALTDVLDVHHDHDHPSCTSLLQDFCQSSEPLISLPSSPDLNSAFYFAPTNTDLLLPDAIPEIPDDSLLDLPDLLSELPASTATTTPPLSQSSAVDEPELRDDVLDLREIDILLQSLASARDNISPVPLLELPSTPPPLDLIFNSLPEPTTTTTPSSDDDTQDLMALYQRSKKRSQPIAPSCPSDFTLSSAIKAVLPLITDYIDAVYDSDIGIAANLQIYILRHCAAVVCEWFLGGILEYNLTLAAVYQTQFGRVLLAALLILASIMHHLLHKCNHVNVNQPSCNGHTSYSHIDSIYCRCVYATAGFCYLDTVIGLSEQFKRFHISADGTIILDTSNSTPGTLFDVVFELNNVDVTLNVLLPNSLLVALRRMTLDSIPFLLTTAQREILDIRNKYNLPAPVVEHIVNPEACVITSPTPVSHIQRTCEYCTHAYVRKDGYHGKCTSCGVTCANAYSLQRVQHALEVLTQRTGAEYNEFCKFLFPEHTYTTDFDPCQYFLTQRPTNEDHTRSVVSLKPLISCRVCCGLTYCVDCILHRFASPFHIYALVSRHKSITMRFPLVICSQICYDTMINRNSKVNERCGVRSKFDTHYDHPQYIGLLLSNRNKLMYSLLPRLPSMPIVIYHKKTTKTKKTPPANATTAETAAK